MNEKSSSKRTTLWLCITAMFMALNVAMSSFGVPVPGGHLYMNDIVICTAAIILDPFAAFMVGGVGAFLGDLLFYPTPMFVSLATHGLQAVAISVFSQKNNYLLNPLLLGTARHDGAARIEALPASMYFNDTVNKM